MHTHVQGVYIYLLLQRKLAEIVYIYKPCLCLHVYTMYRGTTKLRNENETKRNEVSQNETKYIKQSIKDPKTINEGVKINEILSG